MISFTSLVVTMVLSGFIGLIVGVTLVLFDRRVSLGMAILYSINFLVFPISILRAYIRLYRYRHIIFERYAKRKSLSKQKKAIVKYGLDTRSFQIFLFKDCAVKVLNPKWQIKVFVYLVEQNHIGLREFVQESKEKTIEKDGWVGYIRNKLNLNKINEAIMGMLGNEVYGKKYV